MKLEDQMSELKGSAADAASFLGLLAQEHRLMILCRLVEGEASVNQLATILEVRATVISQHLAKLRAEGFVTARRDGTTIHYALADGRVRAFIELLYDTFCGPEARKGRAR